LTITKTLMLILAKKKTNHALALSGLCTSDGLKS